MVGPNNISDMSCMLVTPLRFRQTQMSVGACSVKLALYYETRVAVGFGGSGPLLQLSTHIGPGTMQS